MLVFKNLIIFYSIISYFLLSLLKLFIFNEKKKWSDPDGRGGGEALGGAEGGKCNQDILCEEKHLFSIKGKLILSDILLIIQ